MQTVNYIFRRMGRHFRVRHRKGHGVHSPFAYSLVREIFMTRELLEPKETKLLQELTALNVNNRYAVELQNVHSFCAYDQVYFDSLDGQANRNVNTTRKVLYVITPRVKNEADYTALKSAPDYKTGTLMVIAPYKSRRRYLFCRELIDKEECLSIDRGKYMLFFYDRSQPAQHFKI